MNHPQSSDHRRSLHLIFPEPTSQLIVSPGHRSSDPALPARPESQAVAGLCRPSVSYSRSPVQVQPSTGRYRASAVLLPTRVPCLAQCSLSHCPACPKACPTSPLSWPRYPKYRWHKTGAPSKSEDKGKSFRIVQLTLCSSLFSHDLPSLPSVFFRHRSLSSRPLRFFPCACFGELAEQIAVVFCWRLKVSLPSSVFLLSRRPGSSWLVCVVVVVVWPGIERPDTTFDRYDSLRRRQQRAPRRPPNRCRILFKAFRPWAPICRMRSWRLDQGTAVARWVVMSDPWQSPNTRDGA